MIPFVWIFLYGYVFNVNMAVGMELLGSEFGYMGIPLSFFERAFCTKLGDLNEGWKRRR